MFFNIPQIQYKNPWVQIMMFKNMTPSPFLRFYLGECGASAGVDCPSSQPSLPPSSQADVTCALVTAITSVTVAPGPGSITKAAGIWALLPLAHPAPPPVAPHILHAHTTDTGFAKPPCCTCFDAFAHTGSSARDLLLLVLI